MNFKECKKIFEDYSKGKISKKEFDEWSKKHCETCKLFIKGHCIFGVKNK